MKISSKGMNALIFMLDLAEHTNEGYIALKDIANRQSISKKYLEQILTVLNRSQLLLTNRGYHGGYKLAVSPEKISVGDVLRLTENSLNTTSEKDADMGSDEGIINTVVFRGLREVVNGYLDSISIQDIIDRKQALYADFYVI